MIYYYRWDKTIAKKIATQEGIKKLSYIHWKIIYFIRDYYASFNTLPTYRIIIDYISSHTNKNINTAFIYKLFPKGLGPQGFKIAGFSNYNRCI